MSKIILYLYTFIGDIFYEYISIQLKFIGLGCYVLPRAVVGMNVHAQVTWEKNWLGTVRSAPLCSPALDLRRVELQNHPTAAPATRLDASSRGSSLRHLLLRLVARDSEQSRRFDPKMNLIPLPRSSKSSRRHRRATRNRRCLLARPRRRGPAAQPHTQWMQLASASLLLQLHVAAAA